MIFSRVIPMETSRFRQASAAAPAPDATSFTSLIDLPTISIALSIAADTTIAVPCWSSWKTGMDILSRRYSSTMKQSGALISSRLIPPNVGSRRSMVFARVIGSSSSISISKTSILANFLNNTAFPSITGLDASGPIAPKPNTAVPLLITPTKLARAV